MLSMLIQSFDRLRRPVCAATAVRTRAFPSASIFKMNVDSYSLKDSDRENVVRGVWQHARQSNPHSGCRFTTMKSRATKKPLALLSRRDNHLSAATANRHSGCRAPIIQIVAI